MAGHPRTNKGKGCQSFANGAINGANKQPTLEIVEQDPTAWVLKFVGYNSEVTKKTMVNAKAEDALPTLKYVFDALTLTRKKLDGRVPLLGFTGAPVI